MERSDLTGINSSELRRGAAALADGALLVELTDQEHLQLTGTDRVDFLHGQVSNDVRGLPIGGTNRSLMLNHRGHALAQMTVVREEEELDVIVEAGAGTLVEASLRQHIIFDQVVLGRREGRRVTFTLQGPAAGDLLSRALGIALPDPGRVAEAAVDGKSLRLLGARRSAGGGFDLHLPSDAASSLRELMADAGAVLGSTMALELARVCAGVPSAAGEGGGGVLPQEAGLGDLVSYRKGCYLGQEIMARIEARGTLRRELAGLRLESEPTQDERDLLLGGKTVGRLGTVARHPELGFLALAVLRSDLPEGESLEVGGSSARRVALPFVEPFGLGRPLRR